MWKCLSPFFFSFSPGCDRYVENYVENDDECCNRTITITNVMENVADFKFTVSSGCGRYSKSSQVNVNFARSCSEIGQVSSYFATQKTSQVSSNFACSADYFG